MGKFFTEIPNFVVPWIQKQKLFYVATAPLSDSGHVNVSPKGVEGTFNIIDEKTVWYEDLTGSGIETISHLRENGRLTIMFCAFEGPPQIVRLFGTGTVLEFGTPEYNALIPKEKRHPGSRSVIMLDVHKVGTSCGFSIPFFTYKAPRNRLLKYSVTKEAKDVEAEASCFQATANSGETVAAQDSAELERPVSDKGLKAYWQQKNNSSIDGLPGLLTAFKSARPFDQPIDPKIYDKDDESVSTSSGKTGREIGLREWLDIKLLIGFILGLLASGLWVKLATIAMSTNLKV